MPEEPKIDYKVLDAAVKKVLSCTSLHSKPAKHSAMRAVSSPC